MDLAYGNISAPIICILDMYSFLDTIFLSETSDLAPEIHSMVQPDLHSCDDFNGARMSFHMLSPAQLLCLLVRRDCHQWLNDTSPNQIAQQRWHQ